ncbi:MAG: S8 family serine peptidase, partial [Planctomycetota bacterium]
MIVRFADTGPEAPIRKAIPGPLTNRAVKNVISNMAVPGAAVHKEYDRIVPGLTLVKLPAHTTVADGLFGFSRSPDILYVEPNYKLKLFVTPNDPYFYFMWGMHNTGQMGGTVDADIDAPETWDIHTGDPNIIVAVIDTGVDYNHPDLTANMWINPGEDNPPLGVVDANDFDNVDDDGNGYIDDIYGYDFGGADGNTSGEWDNDPMDFYGHGTAVAGVIGAVGNNHEGVAGVCWNVSIMPLKFFADDGSGGYISDEIEAIDYARVMGVDVINTSFGGYFESLAEYDVITAADANGILFVAAAGNENNDNDTVPSYPASYDLDNIISVMATNQNDKVANYSNYGETSVDIAAPGGEQEYPWDYRGILSCVPGGGYEALQGTSMAASHVAGAAALVWSTDPNMSHTQVKEMLLHPLAVDHLPSLQGYCDTGGRLNVFNALNLPPIGDLVVNTSIPYDSNDPNTFWTTIQSAIEDANDGDELIADAGMYAENIDFLGRAISLRSGNVYDYNDPNINRDDTFIFGGNNGSVVTFQNGEEPNTILKGFTITGGSAEYGGGIECDGASPTITDCIITYNTAMYNGGGIECSGASPTITDCIITYNTAMYNGGGIECDGASPTITDCIITYNTAMYNGGGIECSSASPTITDCIITYNTAMYYGGGIECDDASPTITDCNINNNTAEYYGGGIDCFYASPVITNCIITDNQAYGNLGIGGGINCEQASPTIRHCFITNNNANNVGGGVACYYSDPNIFNCFILGNSATYQSGGIDCETSSPAITNCTIVNNTAAEGGGILADQNSLPTITNCILWNNGDDLDGCSATYS